MISSTTRAEPSGRDRTICAHCHRKIAFDPDRASWVHSENARLLCYAKKRPKDQEALEL